MSRRTVLSIKQTKSTLMKPQKWRAYRQQHNACVSHFSMSRNVLSWTWNIDLGYLQSSSDGVPTVANRSFPSRRIPWECWMVASWPPLGRVIALEYSQREESCCGNSLRSLKIYLPNSWRSISLLFWINICENDFPSGLSHIFWT